MRVLVPVALIAVSLSAAPRALGQLDMAAQQQQVIQQQQFQLQQNEAANQATMASLQANQDAALLAAQQAQCDCTLAWAPRVSAPAGNYSGPLTVKLKSRTRHARIFYTTDGWTPTEHSIPYTGPITLDASTTLQAIAIAPKYGTSLVTRAAYTLPKMAAAPTAAVVLHGSNIAQGTTLAFRFVDSVDSTTAYTGQRVKLALAQDLILDGRVIAPAGTPAVATVTEADGPRLGRIPGLIAFDATSLELPGQTIALAGTRTLQGGEAGLGRRALLAIPVVGVAANITRGNPAEIEPGATFTAAVAKDTAVVSATPAP